jgi:type I restriction enzyme, S subunit
MKIVNLKNPVMASWLREQGFRLDAPPFLSGAIEARKLLEQLPVKKEPLASLTTGHNGGIFNGPKFARTYVDDPEYGVPFVGSSDMLQADLSRLPLLGKKDAYSPALSYLRLEEGMTLISCSGTIGRMVYVRSDMAGMWSSQHIMKVVPYPERILPGYLYAFLSSKFGESLVVGGTYGAIIQHIEPHHITNLPVPRLGEAVETRAHELVQEAAAQRSKAATLRAEALAIVVEELGWREPAKRSIYTSVSSLLLTRRMDAFHHSSPVVAAKKTLASHLTSIPLGDKVAEVFEPNRGARRKVSDPAYGVPFLSSSEMFHLDPQGDYLISLRTPNLERLLIGSSDVLLPRSGQLGGIIGRAVLPLPGNYGHAASEHLVRVRCKSPGDALYVWSILASEPGYFASIGTAFGSSIPSLACVLLHELKVPWFTGAKRSQIEEIAAKMVTLLASAIEKDHEAVRAVESAIEEAA